jgi:hypothetical protein
MNKNRLTMNTNLQFFAANAGLIKTEDIDVTAREIDFVTSFERSWEALREVLGISRAIKKLPGTVLKSKYAEGTLESGTVAEGDMIPRTHYTVKEKPYAEITLGKYAKEVSIEAIMNHGYEAACGMTDEEFKTDLQDDITTKFYNYLKTGTLTNTTKTFQMAVAKAIGSVKNKFKSMHKTATGVAVFVNMMDLYDYLGNSKITLQTAFGLTYINKFLGADIMILCSDNEIPAGKVLATAVNNIVAYYVDPSDADFKKAGLSYTVSGETNLIGFKVKGDHDCATSVTYALLGFVLFAEYIDAVANVSITPGE